MVFALAVATVATAGDAEPSSRTASRPCWRRAARPPPRRRPRR